MNGCSIPYLLLTHFPSMWSMKNVGIFEYMCTCSTCSSQKKALEPQSSQTATASSSHIMHLDPSGRILVSTTIFWSWVRISDQCSAAFSCHSEYDGPQTAGSSLNVQKVKFSSLGSTKSGDVLLENWSNPVSVVPMAMVPWRSLLQALAEGLSLTSEETILRRSGRFLDGETSK